MNLDIQSAFSQDNAKNTQREELASSFVVTREFGSCLCAKHQYIFGTRGSGKTAIARMLSHDHLVLIKDEIANSAINDPQFIGVYVNTSLGFISSLRQNQNRPDSEIELDFRWRFNVSSCIALTYSVQSCMSAYITDGTARMLAECRIADILSDLWTDSEKFSSLRALRNNLEALVLKRDQAMAKRRYLHRDELKSSVSIPGSCFDVDLLLPFVTAANRVADEILPRKQDTAWVLSIDEAEFLHPAHRRMINTLIRSRLPNLFIKVITLPYEFTLETNLPNCHLDINNDVEFVFLDSSFADVEDISNAGKIGEQIFNARIKLILPNFEVDLGKILGESLLLDVKSSSEAWVKGSPLWDLLRKHCAPKTIERATRLAGTKEFSDQVGRKIAGVLLLVDAIKDTSGKSRLQVYSGKSMFFRCSDGNPRRLIRLLKEVVIALEKKQETPIGQLTKLAGTLSCIDQNDILRQVAQSLVDRVVSEPVLGRDMDIILREIGEFIHQSLVKRKISTDIVSGISINITDDALGPAIKKLISVGYLFPQSVPNRPTTMPEGLITIRMAYIFAPLFKFMPRKGRHKNWRSPRRMLELDETNDSEDTATDDPNQLSIWDKP